MSTLGEADGAQALRAAGLKATRPRLLVLKALYDLGGHHSADEIVDLLQSRGTPLLRGSVYGVVESLVSHGLIMAADVGPGRALYEAGNHWHHHFVCLACGQVQDVPCVVGSKPCLDPSELDAEVVEAAGHFSWPLRRMRPFRPLSPLNYHCLSECLQGGLSKPWKQPNPNVPSYSTAALIRPSEDAPIPTGGPTNSM